MTDEERCAEAEKFRRIDAAFRAGDLTALRLAFDDPAVVPNEDEYVRPRHLVLTAIFAVLGFVLALAVVIVKLLRPGKLRINDPDSH